LLMRFSRRIEAFLKFSQAGMPAEIPFERNFPY
jgi:hypothetical protein